jgi:hypothetical protein
MRIIVSIIFYFIFLIYFPEKSFLVFLKEKCHFKRLTVPSTRGYCSTVDFITCRHKAVMHLRPYSFSYAPHVSIISLTIITFLAGQRLFRKAVSYQLKLR